MISFLNRLAVTGAFFFISVTCFGQQCQVKYFQDNFHRLGESGFPKLTILPDNTLVVSLMSNNLGANLIRLTSLGDTIWNKNYTNPIVPGGNWSVKTLNDVDGNLFSVMNSKYLVKLDASGNVLSSRMLSGLDNYGFVDAAIFPDGDKLIFYQIQNAYNYGGVLIRMDKSLGYIKWCRQIGGTGLQFSNMILDGNKVVIAGQSFISPFDFSKMVSFVAQIDGNNGDMLAARSYIDPESASHATFLYKSGNGYIIVGDTYFSGGQNIVKPYYIRLTSDLHIQVSKRITELPGINARLYFLLPENDGSFYGTYGESFNLTIFKVNSRDSLLWVRRQPSYMSYPGDIEQNEDGLFVTGLQNWHNVVTDGAETNFFLSKSDFNGNLAGCPSLDVNEIGIIDFPFTESAFVLSSSAYNAAISNQNTVVSSNPLDLSFPCMAVSSCNSIKLMGDTAICNSQKVLFTGRKNQSCTNPVQWKIFPDQGYSQEIINDSTISVQFTESGEYQIKSSLTSCVETRDSLNLHVNLSAGINLGPDTIICGNTITLHAGNQFKNYVWQDGSTDSVYTSIDSGTYSVQVFDYCKNKYFDTVKIKKAHFTLGIPSEILKCQNETLRLQADPGFTHYQWSPDYFIDVQNGGNLALINVKTDTSYILSAQKWPGCIIQDTVKVKLKPQPYVDLGSDTVLCDGTVKRLSVNYPGAGFSWQDGSTGSDFQVDHAGIYSVTANLKNCLASDTINIQYQHLPVITADKEMNLCSGQELIINPGVNYSSSFQWQDGNTSLNYPVKNAGLYILTAENICGITKDSILVKAGVCEIFMPSAFSPNRDGHNDIFRVRYPFKAASFSLDVYNRWGQRVFETEDMGKGWDGTIHGQDSPAGTYVWFISFQSETGKSESLKGTVILIR